MKLIHINASYKPAYIYGGPALSVSRLCEGLVRAGADLEVITTTANGKEELNVQPGIQKEVDGVRVTYFSRITKDHTHFSPGLLQELWRKLRENGGRNGKRSEQKGERALIVHIHAWWNLVSVFSCFLARQRKVPVILTPRGTLSSYSFGNRNAGIKNYIHRYLGKRLLEYCHFHVTSEKEKEDILKLLRPKSITVIPNFIYLPEPGKQTDPSRESTDPVQLLFLSRIEEKKGLDILFQALSGLDHPYHLTIAGTGEQDYINKLQDLAKGLNIDASLSWVGQQDQQQKWAVLRDHDLLILPSHDENFANVVIECLAMGTPVLLSNKVGLADYVNENNLGWVAELKPQAIRAILIEAISDSEKTAKIRAEAPAKIRSDFDEATLIKRYLKMYTEIILAV